MKLGILLLLFLLLFGCVQEGAKIGGGEMVKGKVLFVIAPSDFRDEELFDAKSAVEKAGYATAIASTSMDTAKGMLGGTAKPDILVEEANVDDYEAIVFVGGGGVEEHLLYEDDAVLDLARSAYEKGKIVGAICIAPRILAKADLVDGKKVTSFGDATTKGMLSEAGGIFTGSSVEQDGKNNNCDRSQRGKGVWGEVGESHWVNRNPFILSVVKSNHA